MEVCGGPTDGTSLGGRKVKLSELCELPKNWASAVAENTASHTPAAKTSWPPLPVLVPPRPIGHGFRPQSRQIQAISRGLPEGLSPLTPCGRRNRGPRFTPAAPNYGLLPGRKSARSRASSHARRSRTAQDPPLHQAGRTRWPWPVRRRDRDAAYHCFARARSWQARALALYHLRG